MRFTRVACVTTAWHRLSAGSVLDGFAEARAYQQLEVFAAAVLFARTEGIIPAPESSHAVKAAIDEALLAKQEGRKRTILFNLSGHGHFDMSAYDAYLGGQLQDHALSADDVNEALAELAPLPLPS